MLDILIRRRATESDIRDGVALILREPARPIEICRAGVSPAISTFAQRPNGR
jgi:hypothetical protein